MEYSKLKRIEVKNFRIIDDVVIDFSESPIVSLLGLNEAGKTSIIKAIEVLGLNKGNLKSYVKEGKSDFIVTAQLDDKTFIKRQKGKKNISQVMNGKGEMVLDTNKVDRGYKIEEIDKVLGFWQEEETGQSLQVRTYEEQLLFATTKASENYKLFYEALKVEDLLKGIRYGNDVCNEIKGVIRDEVAKKKGLLEFKEQTKVYDLSELKKVRDSIAQDEKYCEMLERIKELRKEEKEEIQIPPSIEYFNVVEELKGVRDNCKSIEIKIPPKVSKVSNYMQRMKVLMVFEKIYNTSKAYSLDNIKECIEKEKVLKQEVANVDKELKECHLICPNCHEVIC